MRRVTKKTIPAFGIKDAYECLSVATTIPARYASPRKLSNLLKRFGVDMVAATLRHLNARVQKRDAEYNSEPITSARIKGKRLDVVKRLDYLFANAVNKRESARPSKLVKYRYEFVKPKNGKKNDPTNMKLGENVASWATLPGDISYSILEFGGQAIQGTCGKNCSVCFNDCYVHANMRHSNVIYSMARNTWGLRYEPQKVFSDLGKHLKRLKADIIRINESGELQNMQELENWVMLAQDNPNKTFYIYSKRFDLLGAIGELPPNFKILFSAWAHVGVDEYNANAHKPGMKAFVYVKRGTIPELEIEYYCPAYRLDGTMNHAATCSKCKACFSDKYSVIGCYDH